MTDHPDKSSLPMRDSLGTRISLLRRQKGLTQDALASALGVSRSAVAQWETNRGGEAHYLARIAAIVGVSAEVFLNGMASRDTVETVTVDEAELLRLYRGCNTTDRILVLRSVARLSKPP